MLAPVLNSPNFAKLSYNKQKEVAMAAVVKEADSHSLKRSTRHLNQTNQMTAEEHLRE